MSRTSSPRRRSWPRGSSEPAAGASGVMARKPYATPMSAPARRSDDRSVVTRRSRRASDSGLLEPTALPLGQTAPDAEALVVVERVLEALDPDLAGGADPLGLSGR